MRRAAPAGLGLGLLALAVIASFALLGGGATPGRPAPATAAAPRPVDTFIDAGTAPAPLALRLADPRDAVRVDFKRPPRAGILFDVDTGRVLWRRRATRRLPVASLTKMMTALVVADRLAPRARARIWARALRYRGSGVGLLPRGRRVTVRALLHGLLLPSGNDAARALAEAAGGTIRAFVSLMNERAARLGMACTHFTSPDGLRDAGNRSCAADLAALGRALLRVPRLARIVRKRRAVLPFPIKGGRLFLSNSNPLLRSGYRGTTGVKTGYTDAAGRCIVATARRGGVHLGVALLHSPDTGRQAQQLLDRGFRALRVAVR